jgi:hypothetical protein
MGKISAAEVLRLRATSAMSRDQSVRRFAQDDDSVGVSTKKPLNKLALIGHGPGLFSAAPLGLNSYVVFYTQTLKTVNSFKDNSFPQAGKPVPDSSDLRF